MHDIRDRGKKMKYKHTRESSYILEALALLNPLNLSMEDPMKRPSVNG